jgi:hypothetical protein
MERSPASWAVSLLIVVMIGEMAYAFVPIQWIIIGGLCFVAPVAFCIIRAVR